ncbi:MAG: hypothetical protein WCI31_08690 [Prolixibacteraceae bacterium]
MAQAQHTENGFFTIRTLWGDDITGEYSHKEAYDFPTDVTLYFWVQDTPQAVIRIENQIPGVFALIWTKISTGGFYNVHALLIDKMTDG